MWTRPAVTSLILLFSAVTSAKAPAWAARPRGGRVERLAAAPIASALPGGGRLAGHADGSVTFLGRLELPGDELSLSADELDLTTPLALLRALEQARDALGLFVGAELGHAELTITAVRIVDDLVAVKLAQRAGGLPIEGAVALVELGPNGVRYVYHTLVQRAAVSGEVRLTSGQAEALAGAHLLGFARPVAARPVSSLVAVASAGKLRRAWRVDLDTRAPWGLWRVWVDADDGAVLGWTEQGLAAVQGEVRFRVEPRCQGQGTAIVPMPSVQWTTGQHVDDAGSFFSATPVSQARVELKSPNFTLINHSGALAPPVTVDLAPTPAHNAIEILDAPLDQVDPFYHAHTVRSWARARFDQNSGAKRWTDQRIDVHINIPETCNAYYDGSINFFVGGNGCNNTGRVAGIVYHEYGHGLHHHSDGPVFDIQVSEGVADFTAATITDDPQIGGLFSCNDAFRTCDNDYSYCQHGCTYGPSSEVHVAGQPLCAVFWELRQLLSARYGRDLGVATTERLFLAFLTRVGGMFSAYDALVASDDDPDADLSNGTTHSCEINRAFANDAPGATPHFPDLVGAVPSQPSLRIEHRGPGRVLLGAADPLRVEATIGYDHGCATTGGLPEVVLHYVIDGGDERTAVMQAGTSNTEGVVYAATLDQGLGPATISYWITARLADTEFVYPYQGPKCPKNGAWPCYRQMMHLAASGETTLFFSDFEADDGGLMASSTATDGKTDFEWGTPAGIAGDPTSAVSGTRVWGTDLGAEGDGLYEGGRTSWLTLPPFDASAMEEVHLQFWRQLSSSDTAKIQVNGHTVYQQRWTSFFWRDPFWLFQDLDISAHAAGQAEVSVRFVMSDEFEDSFELGGWNLDDLRVTGVPLPALAEVTSSPAVLLDPVYGGCAAGMSPGGGTAALALSCVCRRRRRMSRRED